MKTPQETREEQVVESLAPEYVAPQVEVVLTPDELAREVQYAGTPSGPQG